jgi:hypothetical protein
MKIASKSSCAEKTTLAKGPVEERWRAAGEMIRLLGKMLAFMLHCERTKRWTKAIQSGSFLERVEMALRPRATEAQN